MSDADSRGEIPLGMKLDGNLDLIAEVITQLFYRDQRLIDIVPRDVFILVALGGAVEGPYLDAP